MKSYLYHTISVFIIILLMSHAFSESLVQIAFDFNQEYIQSELCVQRDSAFNTCEGKCYLKNQLEKDREKKQQPQYQVQKENYYLPVADVENLKHSDIDRPEFFSIEQDWNAEYTPTLFRPPIFG